MEPGGAQELRLLGLRRAKVPHTVTEPEDRQVCLLTGFTIFENYLSNGTTVKPKLINDLGRESLDHITFNEQFNRTKVKNRLRIKIAY